MGKCNNGMLEPARGMRHVHVGGFFKRRYIDTNDDVTLSSAAQHIGVRRRELREFCEGAAGCTPEMAVRLAAATDTNVEFWMRMQANYDMGEALRTATPANVIRLPEAP